MTTPYPTFQRGVSKCAFDYRYDNEELLTDGCTSTTTAGKLNVKLAHQSSFKYTPCEVHMCGGDHGAGDRSSSRGEMYCIIRQPSGGSEEAGKLATVRADWDGLETSGL